MSRIIQGIKRLWLIAMCDHRNGQRCLEFDEVTRITVCKLCGQVTQFTISQSDNAYTPYVGSARKEFNGPTLDEFNLHSVGVTK